MRGATKHHTTPLIPISLSLSATTLSGETITTPPHATEDRTSSPHHRMEWTLCIKEKLVLNFIVGEKLWKYKTKFAPTFERGWCKVEKKFEKLTATTDGYLPLALFAK